MLRAGALLALFAVGACGDPTSSTPEGTTGDECTGDVLFGRPGTLTGLTDEECQPRCTCGGASWEPPAYGTTDIDELLRWELVDSPAPLSSDPYASADPPTEDADVVCAVLPEAAGSRTYRLVTYDSEAAAKAAGAYATHFGACGLCSPLVDLAVFNASLHYATDLGRVLAEARRVTRPGGQLAILDSPFYRREADGLAMVAEKQRRAAEQFGERADRLMALPFIEFLTRARLEIASAPLGLVWRRHRVLYPLAYELRPLRAALRGDRVPSRFDLWVGERP